HQRRPTVPAAGGIHRATMVVQITKLASMKFTFLETSTRREKLFLFLKFGRESVVNCWAESFAAAAEPETSSRALAVGTDARTLSTAGPRRRRCRARTRKTVLGPL